MESVMEAVVEAEAREVGPRDDLQLLLEAVDATRHAAGLWAKLAGPYLRGLYRSSHRWASTALAYATRRFRELDEDTQKSIFASVAILALLIASKRLLERAGVFEKVRRRYDRQAARARLAWRRVNKRIGRTSKILADLLPHLILASLFALYLVAMPRPARNTLEGPVVYFALGKAYPAVWSAEALAKGSDKLGGYLRLWTSFYILEVAGEAPGLVPLLSPLVRCAALDFLRAARLFLALWIALPFTDGAGRVCSALSPARPPEAEEVRGAEKKRGRREVAGWLLDTAAGAGLIRVPAAIRGFAADLVTHWVHLMSIPFAFTPGFITYYGTVLSGKVFPIRASLRAQDTEDVRQWTTYWVVFSALDCAHGLVGSVVGWIPFWQHARLVAIFWLQFPYFQGAGRLFAKLDKDRLARITGKVKLRKKVKAAKGKETEGKETEGKETKAD